MESSPTEYREQLISLLTMYKPDQLAKVDEMMLKYVGREEALLTALRERYNVPEPVAKDKAKLQVEEYCNSSNDNINKEKEGTANNFTVACYAEQSKNNERVVVVAAKERELDHCDISYSNNTTDDHCENNKPCKYDNNDTSDKEDTLTEAAFTSQTNNYKHSSNVVEQECNGNVKEDNDNNIRESIEAKNTFNDVESISELSNKEHERDEFMNVGKTNINNRGKADLFYEKEKLTEEEGVTSINERVQLNNTIYNADMTDTTSKEIEEKKEVIKEVESINDNKHSSEDETLCVYNVDKKCTSQYTATEQIRDYKHFTQMQTRLMTGDKMDTKREEHTANDTASYTKMCNALTNKPQNKWSNCVDLIELFEEYFTTLGVLFIHRVPHIDKPCCSFLLQNIFHNNVSLEEEEEEEEEREKENDTTKNTLAELFHLPQYVTFSHFCEVLNEIAKRYKLSTQSIVNNIKYFLCRIKKFGVVNAFNRESSKTQPADSNTFTCYNANNTFDKMTAKTTQTRNRRRNEGVFSLSTSMAVTRNRHECISEKIYATCDLQYGFMVYRSIRPSVFEKWVQCWGCVTTDARLTCTFPRSTKLEIIIPFEHILECKLQSFASHNKRNFYDYNNSNSSNSSSSSSSNVRSSTLPPSMAKNGVCFTLTHVATPLQLWLCTTSMFIAQAIVRRYRAWQRHREVQHRSLPLLQNINVNDNNCHVNCSTPYKQHMADDGAHNNDSDTKRKANTAIENSAFADTPLSYKRPTVYSPTQKVSSSSSPLERLPITITHQENMETGTGSCHTHTRQTTEEIDDVCITVSDTLSLNAFHVWTAQGGSLFFQHEKWAIVGSSLIFEIIEECNTAATTKINSNNNNNNNNNNDINHKSDTHKLQNPLKSKVHIWPLSSIHDIIFNDTTPLSLTQPPTFHSPLPYSPTTLHSSTPSSSSSSILKLSFHNATFSMIRKPNSFHTVQSCTPLLECNRNNNNNNNNKISNSSSCVERSNQITSTKATSNNTDFTHGANDGYYFVIRCQPGFTLFCVCATPTERSQLIHLLSCALIRISLHVASPEISELSLPHGVPGMMNKVTEKALFKQR